MRVKQTLTVIWFALLVTQVTYLIVGELTFGESTATIDLVMSRALSLVAACSIFAGLNVHAFGIRRGLAAGTLDPSTASGRQRTLTLFVISWALCESAAVMGLILRLLGAPTSLHIQIALAAGVTHVAIGPWVGALRAKQ